MNTLLEPSIEKHHSLLEKFSEKKMCIGVIGLGYVGYPLSLRFSQENISVIGFDIDEKKITQLNAGEGHIAHIPRKNLTEAIEKQKFSATSNFSKVSDCDALIICVPTPLTKQLEPDLSYVTNTCKQIGKHLKKNTLVCLESTTWPGTTLELVRPLLEDLSGFKVGKDLFLCFSPEREDPGNQKYTTKNIPKLVGADDQISLDLAIALYSSAIDTVVPVSSSKVAESTKLYENIFRSVNIALANEMKVIFDKMGIDVWEVLEAASTKPFGFIPFTPGPGLGGHCIPIDPFYLSWKAKEHGIGSKFIELAGEINRSMPEYVVQKVVDCLNNSKKAVRDSRILILGVSYKANIDDLRESPSLKIFELLEQKGASVSFSDPHFSKIGKLRNYPQLEGRSSCSLSNDFDCFILATNHSLFSAEEILSFGVPIVDTRNFFPHHPLVTQA